MTERESRAWHLPGQGEVYDLADTPNARPVIKLCNAILLEAIRRGAARVRVLPAPSFGDVSYEVEGTWQPVMHIPIKVLEQALNRFKVMADLDVAKRSSQTGRMALRVGQQTLGANLTVILAPATGEEALVEFDALTAGAAAV